MSKEKNLEIPITKPYFTEEEYSNIRIPLETGWVAQGPFVRELEEQFSRFTDAQYAVAFNSCT
ncbi:DegT/DnrJ/EryC1/StrS family aminotransferase, partial [Elusimicrobiota bacterium]